MIHDVLSGILVLVASFFTLVAAIGIVRLPDLYTRMHAASKVGTLGSCVMMLALALRAGNGATLTLALAGVAFFLATAPISAHLLAKAARSAGFPLWPGSVLDQMPRAIGDANPQENADPAASFPPRK